jgi:hypothetical protein
MKRLIPFALVLLAACAKHEVDIASLNTNPFDADWHAQSLMIVDSAITFPLVPGAVYQQRIYISFDPRVTAVNDYALRMIEYTLPDTVMGVSTGAANGQMRILNNQVQLGQTYCFDFDLLIEDQALTNHRISACYTATL